MKIRRRKFNYIIKFNYFMVLEFKSKSERGMGENRKNYGTMSTISQKKSPFVLLLRTLKA